MTHGIKVLCDDGSCNLGARSSLQIGFVNKSINSGVLNNAGSTCLSEHGLKFINYLLSLDEFRAGQNYTLINNCLILWQAMIQFDDYRSAFDGKSRSLDVALIDDLGDLTLEDFAILGKLI